MFGDSCYYSHTHVSANRPATEFKKRLPIFEEIARKGDSETMVMG